MLWNVTGREIRLGGRVEMPVAGNILILAAIAAMDRSRKRKFRFVRIHSSGGNYGKVM